MKKYVILLTALLLMLVVGCSKDKDENQSAKDQSNEEAVEKGVFPLTGLEGKGIDRRIVSVMVNNHAKARPQTGLSQADLVFEILAEGNITRFLALYHSEEPEVVGPVRSAREYYFDLAERYQAIYIHHGAADFISDMIKERGIDSINGSSYDNDGHLFKRDDRRQAPHNSYLQFGAVNEIAGEKGFDITETYEPLPFLTEEETEQIEGEKADRVEITYFKSPLTTVTYQYDATKDVYDRYSDGEQSVELESNQPIELSNVLIIETAHEVIDDQGRRKVDLDSGGQAYLLQKGLVQKLEWQSVEGRILPVKDGQPVGLIPGKTWINVIPTSPGLEGAVTVQ
ncbi:MAG TPA: DUF3048 domain-containing protein [Cerasibacillus sp.]|uniref:DUF3048 domain-containing protein n=1 Tax=Cerasibacillus sp. TaxID=2498711 RepID=UPI002F40A0CF